MADSKHTPGPWNFTQEDVGDDEYLLLPWTMVASNGVHVVDSDGGLSPLNGKPVCQVERFANARLIAAAPEMADLLVTLRRVVIDLAEECAASGRPSSEFEELETDINALLARIDGDPAEGGVKL